MNPWKQFRRRLRAWAARLRGDAEAELRWTRRIEWDGLEGVEVEVQRDGLTWILPVGDYSVAKRIYVDGVHQREDLRALMGWLRKQERLTSSGVFVDVGANLGSPALTMAKWTEGRVLAIEPEPATFARLAANVRRNGLADRVATVNAAVSDREGVLHLEVPRDPSKSELGLGPGVDVAALPLDEILARQPLSPADVVLVWSDTQGHERQVIEGGTRLWSTGVPLFTELWPEGLSRHGGSEAFIASATSCFSRWIPSADLRAREGAAEPRPIASLGDFLKALDGHTDALLIP